MTHHRQPDGAPPGWQEGFLTRLRAAVRRSDWDEAAAEALDSRWAAQTGRRANDIAAMLRGMRS